MIFNMLHIFPMISFPRFFTPFRLQLLITVWYQATNFRSLFIEENFVNMSSLYFIIFRHVITKFKNYFTLKFTSTHLGYIVDCLSHSGSCRRKIELIIYLEVTPLYIILGIFGRINFDSMFSHLSLLFREFMAATLFSTNDFHFD